MILKVQLYSFIYSFIFGIVFYFLLDIFNKYKSKKVIVEVFLSVIFVFTTSLVYFWGLVYINNGYLHIYFLISILVGYLFIYFIIIKWFTHKRK